jgi:hypothetical protein
MDCGASVGETQLIRSRATALSPLDGLVRAPELTLDALTTIEAEDISQSRVLQPKENGA